MSGRKKTSRWVVTSTLLVFLLSTLLAGCIVRTGPSSHRARHSHRHCHSKKVKKRVHKQKCHTHTHRHDRRRDHH